MRKILATVAAVMLSFVTPSFASQERDYAKMSKNHQRVYDASLALYATLPGTNGDPDVTHFLCTATVVDKGTSNGKPGYLLLTAGHCIEGDGLPEGLKFSVADTIADKPELHPVSVLRVENGDKYDFALLVYLTDKDYPVIPVAVRVPSKEDKVYDVNFSLGIGKQVALGVVATDVLTSKGSEGDCSICDGRYMVHIFAAGGASGSAIVDEKTNEIVGVGEFGFPGDTMGLGCETIVSLAEWMATPEKSSAPKA